MAQDRRAGKRRTIARASDAPPVSSLSRVNVTDTHRPSSLGTSTIDVMPAPRSLVVEDALGQRRVPAALLVHGEDQEIVCRRIAGGCVAGGRHFDLVVRFRWGRSPAQRQSLPSLRMAKRCCPGDRPRGDAHPLNGSGRGTSARFQPHARSSSTRSADPADRTVSVGPSRKCFTNTINAHKPRSFGQSPMPPISISPKNLAIITS